MEPVTVAVITVVLLFCLIIAGVHVGFSLALMSVVGIFWITGKFTVALSILSNTAFESVRDYIFAVLPLFILMGSFMSNSGVARDLYQTANYILRSLPGGMGIATVASNAVFAAVTGVSVASAAVFSRISMPEMLRLNYKKSFAVGAVAGSSVLGMLIPPSVLLIVYGVLSEVSIGKLFVAGIIPGILLAVVYSVGIILMSKLRPELVGGKDSARKFVFYPQSEGGVKGRAKLVLNLVPVGVLMVLVIGGIWGGFFTPTEASAVGALGALILALAKGMRMEGFNESLLETALGTATIMLLLIAAQMYSRMLAMSGLIAYINDVFMGLSAPPIMVIILFVITLVVLGCILDSGSILLITTPLMAPIAAQMGFDLVWFGIVMVLATEMGLLTPPFGMVVYAVKATLGDTITVEEIFKGSFPYLLMMALTLAVIIAFPSLSTWLPSLM